MKMKLTVREREVLGLVARGISRKEISKLLSITPKTVQSHMTLIYDKLDSRGKFNAVKKALVLGIIPMEEFLK